MRQTFIYQLFIILFVFNCSQSNDKKEIYYENQKSILDSNKIANDTINNNSNNIDSNNKEFNNKFNEIIQNFELTDSTTLSEVEKSIIKEKIKELGEEFENRNFNISSLKYSSDSLLKLITIIGETGGIYRFEEYFSYWFYKDKPVDFSGFDSETDDKFKIIKLKHQNINEYIIISEYGVVGDYGLSMHILDFYHFKPDNDGIILLKKNSVSSNVECIYNDNNEIDTGKNHYIEYDSSKNVISYRYTFRNINSITCKTYEGSFIYENGIFIKKKEKFVSKYNYNE
ncbi:MAG: hypothetical protein RLZZ175_2229 [Bacteroidota bacterium]|jgi:hypothetical protein